VQKRFYIEETTRRSWFNPEALLLRAGLVQGMKFVDVGCGDGFFAILAAKIVGETGKVYAVDSDSQAIERLRTNSAINSLTNIEARIAIAEETIFCENCADIVFFSIVLHDFNDPEKVLCNAGRIIKKTGRVVNLDWKKKAMSIGPPLGIRFSEKEASYLIEKAGFAIEEVMEPGPFHYLIVAKPSIGN